MAGKAPNTQIIGGVEITPCEFSIIKPAIQGLGRKEIAAQQDKTKSTIDSQFRNLFLKLQINKINRLVAWAARNGFDDDGNFVAKKSPAKRKNPAQKKAGVKKKEGKKK